MKRAIAVTTLSATLGVAAGAAAGAGYYTYENAIGKFAPAPRALVEKCASHLGPTATISASLDSSCRWTLPSKLARVFYPNSAKNSLFQEEQTASGLVYHLPSATDFENAALVDPQTAAHERNVMRIMCAGIGAVVLGGVAGAVGYGLESEKEAARKREAEDMALAASGNEAVGA